MLPNSFAVLNQNILIHIKMGKNNISWLLPGFISIYGGIGYNIGKDNMGTGFPVLY